ncbi:MAG TPA: TIGR01777 family oxidoreductase [Salinimicrobium sp.]|nr:TIGR01777 family oxidoreductase [Salinimicrobium sp.]
MRILIAGATGLTGSHITRLCHEKDIGVNYLTRHKNKIVQQENYRGYLWDPSTGEIDVNCLQDVVAIVNVTGSSIFKRWTKKNTKEITESRINASELLFKTLKENEHDVVQYDVASAIGIYPSSYEKMYFEDEKKLDNSFLGKLVQQWEASNKKFESLGIRVGIFRTGMILAKDSGALPEMAKPVKNNIGAALGSGKQWQSWIHIEDVARIYLHAIENGLSGTYNAVSPNPVTNEELMYEIAKVLDKKIRLPNVPGFALKLALGNMSQIALSSQLVASKKIEGTGFTFKYTRLVKALQDLL